MLDPDNPAFFEIATLKRDMQELREEVDRVDQWATGIFDAVLDLTTRLLRKDPELAAELEPLWKTSAQRFAQLEHEQGQADDMQETTELYEARKKLYRLLELYKIWPGQTK